MTSEDSLVRLTVNDAEGEIVRLQSSSPPPTLRHIDITPPSPAPPPPPPEPSPVPMRSSGPPDPSLSVLANTAKSKAVIPDSLSFQYVPLSPSMNVSASPPSPPPPTPEPRDEMPQYDLPMQWNDEEPPSNPEPWDMGESEPRVINLPDPEAEARALQKERDDLLFKLDCLGKQVPLPKKFNHTSSIDEMRSTYNRYHRAQQMEAGLQISRKLLIGFTGVIEWLNHRYDPLGAKLDGWSTNIMANVEDFDHALIRVWEKYSNVIGEINPLLELVFALAMSGVMYHFMQKRIEEEVKKQDVNRDDPAFQEEVQRAAQEMFQAQRARASVPPPPPQVREPRRPPEPPVFTNPTRVHRDQEEIQRRSTAPPPVRNPPVARAPAPNPQGILSSLMGAGAGGNQQIQEMMGSLGIGPQGMEFPNFVPPTPAPPVYDPNDVLESEQPPEPEAPPKRPRGRPKKSTTERAVSIDE